MELSQALENISSSQKEPITTLSAKERGKHLSIARALTGLSVDKFLRKHHEAIQSLDLKVSISGWRGWEAALRGGLTPKGAAIAAKILSLEGVYCAPEWLYYGLGNGPRQTSSFDNAHVSAENIDSLNQEKYIALNLEHLKNLYPNLISCVIEDDGMQPYYFKGEYVAGIKTDKKNINSLLGKNCIIQTSEGELLVRRLQSYNDQTNEAVITCLNAALSSNLSMIATIPIKGIAPIIWHMKKI